MASSGSTVVDHLSHHGWIRTTAIDTRREKWHNAFKVVIEDGQQWYHSGRTLNSSSQGQVFDSKCHCWQQGRKN